MMMCFHCRKKTGLLQCLYCLRAGEKTGICSNKCYYKGWEQHARTANHQPRTEFRAVLALLRTHLRKDNRILTGLNSAQRQAIWFDLAVHVSKLIGLETIGCTTGVRLAPRPVAPPRQLPKRR